MRLLLAASVTAFALVSTVSNGSDASRSGGEAVVSINRHSNNVQTSNFGKNSFRIANRGSKLISQVEIDVTDALYPDSVFDPFGVAGDTVSKALSLDTPGGTGIQPAGDDTYVGPGGEAGFRKLVLTFSPDVDGGFEPGESIGFSIDMDPNSIAGARKGPLDQGTDPKWDVGGVCGAELIGSLVTITFADGTRSSAQLHGVGNNAGSHTLVRQDAEPTAVDLTAETGDDDKVRLIVNGPAGATARVVATRGFIQPVTNLFEGEYAQRLDRQLAALRDTPFPANNAFAFQTIDVDLTGQPVDISDALAVPGDASLPMGFVAAAIDPADDGLPVGPVTTPTYLVP